MSNWLRCCYERPKISERSSRCQISSDVVCSIPKSEVGGPPSVARVRRCSAVIRFHKQSTLYLIKCNINYKNLSGPFSELQNQSFPYDCKFYLLIAKSKNGALHALKTLACLTSRYLIAGSCVCGLLASFWQQAGAKQSGTRALASIIHLEHDVLLTH